MAWTAPRTWVTSEVVTAAQLNTHLRDNELWLNSSRAVRVWHSSAITVNDTSDKVLPFNSEVIDTDVFHNTSTNNTRLTVPAGMAGVYIIGGGSNFEQNGTGYRLLKVRLNGSTMIGGLTVPAVGNGPTRLALTTVNVLAVGDYVELLAYQNSGGNLDCASGSDLTIFWMVRIGA
jgi:hypothetical protein